MCMDARQGPLDVGRLNTPQSLPTASDVESHPYTPVINLTDTFIPSLPAGAPIASPAIIPGIVSSTPAEDVSHPRYRKGHINYTRAHSAPGKSFGIYISTRY